MKNTTEHHNMILLFLTRFIRIRGVIVWSSISFIGFILGLSTLELTTQNKPFLFFIISSFCIFSFTFAINNYYDSDSDRTNPRRKHINAIASEHISKQNARIILSIFVAIPVILSLLYHWEILILTCLLLFWMWIYSAPPLRLKGRPGLDIVWHFIAFLLLILWGSLITGSITLLNWLVAISIATWSLISQITNHISDYTYDKKSNTHTFAVWAGLDTTKTTLKITILIHTLILLPLIILYSLQYPTTITILLIGLPISIALSKHPINFPISQTYYPPFVFASFVYLSCLIYHLTTLNGGPYFWI